MKTFSTLKITLILSLLAFTSSCGSEKSDIASTLQSSPTQTSQPNPGGEAGGFNEAVTPATVTPTPTPTDTATTVEKKSPCNFGPECLEVSKLTEVQVEQVYNQLMAQLARVTPKEKSDALTSSIAEERAAWVAYRQTNCKLQSDQAEFAPGRPIQGQTLNFITAGCRAGMNQERIVKLSEIAQSYSQIGAITPTESSSPSMFAPRRVQELTNDGDYLLSEAEDPTSSDSYFVLLRKQGRFVVGYESNVNGDWGRCFRSRILSSNSVETVTPTQGIESDNGVLYNGKPLKYYDVGMLKPVRIDDGEILESCAQNWKV